MAAVSPAGSNHSHGHANTPTGDGDQPHQPHQASRQHSPAVAHFLARNPLEQHAAADFQDLLAEFTLPGNLLSPEAMAARSPPPTGTGAPDESDHQARRPRNFNQTSDHGSFGEGQDAFEYRQGNSSTPAPAPASAPAGAGQLAQAIANMDSATQGQLLAALLARQQSGVGNSTDRQLEHALAAHQAYPNGAQAPYNSFDVGQQQQHLFQQHLAQQYQLAAALNASLPGSHAGSPAGSPFFNGHGGQQQYFPDPAPPQNFQSQFHAQAQAALAHHPSPQQHDSPQSAATTPGSQAGSHNYHNAFSPQQPFMNQAPSHSQADVQTFLAMDVLARVSGSDSTHAPAAYPLDANGPSDMRMRGGSATGGSYATTNGENEDWGDNDFMFSPLMSPALTSHSTFSSVASSLPPSAQSCLPNQPGLNGISPGDFFSPLGSPAIMPQSFQQQQPAWPSPHHTHSNSLQGLVDQTRALAFDVGGFQAAGPGSPTTYSPSSQAAMSPRLGPVDAGQSTATGSGRRGAGGKKARPSPLLKPTPDSALRRKKAPGGAERRSSSIGSSGARSATTSPFLGPTSYGGGIAPLSSSKPPAANGLTRTSPPENSSGSNNTPSPVDLAMHEQAELMGPPPPPSSNNSSRRASLQSTSNAPANSAWMSPVTPASFMNFPVDLSAAGLTQPAGLATTSRRTHSVDTASSDHQDLDADDSGSTAGPSKPKARKTSTPLLPSVQRRDVDEGRPGATAANGKGKGRAGSVSTPGVAGPAGARKIGLKPLAKGPVGPASGHKIKPLLASGLPPDALARLSTKSNYQNIMDGRGVDLLGLDPSTVSALNATQGAGADNRRTSHKAAEQKRRDSLKLCFEELRRILPPIAASAPDEEKRPGEGNVGGQRGGSVDPENPNRGVSKVALLRRSNEYVGMLHDRIDRRDFAIEALRMRLRDAKSRLGEDDDGEEDIDGLDLDNIDRDERAAGTMAFYECLDSDDEQEVKPKPMRKPPAGRRKSNAADAEFKGKPGGAPGGARRSTRRSFTSDRAEDDSEAMDIEDGE